MDIKCETCFDLLYVEAGIYPISWYGPNFTRAPSLLGPFIPRDGIIDAELSD